MVRPIDPEAFEALFKTNPDPWNYAASGFERHKRNTLLRHCGQRPIGRVLELGCANGMTTEALAKGALRVTAIDASASAIGFARKRMSGMAKVQFIARRVQEGLPRGPFDLIVVSELVYYLRPGDADLLARSIGDITASGGRVVALHHHVWFPDARVAPAVAHDRFVSRLKHDFVRTARSRTNRFVVDVLDKPRYR